MAENAFLSRVLRSLPGMGSGVLAVSMLWGPVRGVGAPARCPDPTPHPTPPSTTTSAPHSPGA